jgi:hypothetical protein
MAFAVNAPRLQRGLLRRAFGADCIPGLFAGAMGW